MLAAGRCAGINNYAASYSSYTNNVFEYNGRSVLFDCSVCRLLLTLVIAADGGAVCLDTPAIMENNLFVRNYAGTYAGAVGRFGLNAFTMRNNNFIQNYART